MTFFLHHKPICLYITLVGFVMKIQAQTVSHTFDLQGHRGARGLMPENTIPAFLEALRWQVSTLELDLVVSADSQLVVSHEPWFRADISTKPDGTPVEPGEAESLNIYRMTVSQLQAYDVGKRANPRFPEQQRLAAYKPCLWEVVMAVENWLTTHRRTAVRYNIELKSRPEWYNIMVPEPAVFVGLVLQELERLQIDSLVTLQSFDWALLREIKRIKPGIPVAQLVEKRITFRRAIRQLGFVPQVYSPHYRLVNRRLVEQCRQAGVLLIPWTVNEPRDMQKLQQMGVDGLITDYPNRFTLLAR